MKPFPEIILASSSSYRKELLQRLNITFNVKDPKIDENPLYNESHEELVLRLSCQKAKSVAKNYVAALIIGSDQIATLNKQVLKKPGNRKNAIRQLKTMSGNKVTFLTGLCLYNSFTKECLQELVFFNVSFRRYNLDEIERYLDIENPYDCAGSFKSEKSGINLVSKMDGEDPTALIGLPLIKLTEMLRSQGIKLP